MWKYNCVIVTSLDHVRFRLHRVRHREGLVLRPEPLGGEREGGVAGQLPLDQLHPGAWAWAGRVTISAANRLIGEVVQSRRRPLLGPSPG